MNSLPLLAHSKLIILDDDEAIHQRFLDFAKTHKLSDYGIQLVHFYNENELATYIRLNQSDLSRAYFILDYQLKAKPISLDLIKEHSLEYQTAIMTYHSEDYLLRNKCSELGTKFVSKDALFHLSVEVTALQPDFIIVDDNVAHINKVLEIGIQFGMKGQSFKTGRDFLSIAYGLPKNTPIILDYSLSVTSTPNRNNPEENGSVIFSLLKELRFTQLYLLSNFEKSVLKTLCNINEDHVFSKPPTRELFERIQLNLKKVVKSA